MISEMVELIWLKFGGIIAGMGEMDLAKEFLDPTKDPTMF